MNKCNVLIINLFIQVLNVMYNKHSDQDQILLPGQTCPPGSKKRQRLEACDLEMVYIKTDGKVKECPWLGEPLQTTIGSELVTRKHSF
jgi:hypothetical protein